MRKATQRLYGAAMLCIFLGCISAGESRTNLIVTAVFVILGGIFTFAAERTERNEP